MFSFYKEKQGENSGGDAAKESSWVCLSPAWVCENKDGLTPASTFTEGVTKQGLHPISERLWFSIPFKSTRVCGSDILLLKHWSLFHHIVLVGELSLKCGTAPLKSQLKFPGVCVSLRQHGRAGCPAGFHLSREGSEVPQGHEKHKERPFASEMAGLEAGGTPWVEPTHSRLVTLHDGTEPGCDRWYPWIWDWILALTV